MFLQSFLMNFYYYEICSGSTLPEHFMTNARANPWKTGLLEWRSLQ